MSFEFEYIEDEQLTHRLQEFFKSIDVSNNTIRTYCEALKKFFKWRANNGYNGAIDRREVRDYKNWLKEGKSSNTVSTYIVALRRYLRFCVSREIIPSNPAEDIRGAKRSRGHLKSDLSRKEIRKLLQSINTNSEIGKRDYALVNLMVRCGLRLIEVKRADVGDIENRRDRSILWIKGKGRAEKEEFVVLTNPAIETIEDYLQSRSDEISDRSPLFVGAGGKNKGKRLTTRTIRRRVTKYLKETGLKSERITPHSLRHSFVTLAIEGGASIEKTQAAARHSSISTTQIYFHEHDRLNEPVEDKINI